MILERPAYPTLPLPGPRDGQEAARVVNGMSAGRVNAVIDLDLSAEVSPYTLEHANISAFSWIRPMRDDVAVENPGKQSVVLTWEGAGPALCRLLVIG
jgi:hypothetical protein